MTDLITITEQSINNETVQAVNARELHSFLEVGKVFGAWINDRINQYNFVENQDYILLSEIGKQNGSGGHNKKEYFISIDMAKELSMVERNTKGQQARRYFIDCEKKLKEIAQPQLPTNYLEALQALVEAETEKQALEQQAIINAPKVNHYNRVVNKSNLLTATEIGSKVGKSAIALNKALSVLGVYNGNLKRSKVFKQWFIDKGLGVVKQTDNGYTQALFTTKGEAWIIEQLEAINHE